MNMDFFGYIDPGTGSLFIQSLIGVGLAVGIAFRTTIGKTLRKLRTFLNRQAVKKEER